jgi:transcriptional regulator with XRE-family HTH domain
MDSGENIRVRFGKRIRELRQARGWSQETLGFESDLDRTYISGIERGLRNVSLQNIETLANTLGVSLPELFQGV